MEIEIRSLNGESIRLSVKPNDTVQHLKFLLKQSFAPVSSFPNFHLFFKGVKLTNASQIGSYLIGDGEFLVTIPFIKKDKQQINRVEASEKSATTLRPNKKLEATVAESAWSDLMQDLSSLCDVSRSKDLPELDSKSLNSLNKNTCDRNSAKTKRKRALDTEKERGTQEDDLLSMLKTCGDGIFDENNIRKVIEYMDSSSCLTDPVAGSCVMRDATDPREPGPCTSKTSSCHCPLWMKDLIKAFSVINLYSTHLQLCQKKITISSLEEPLNKLHKFGLRQGIVDLEHLSQVFPEVVCFVNNEMEATKLTDALVILRFSAERVNTHEDQLAAVKPLSSFKIVKSMKKRAASLKAILMRAVKSLISKNGVEMIKSFSPEVLHLLKKIETETTKSNVKRNRDRYLDSGASSSHSCEFQCHATNPLLPEEMVGHLKSMLGSQGQVVHIEEISARKATYVEIPCQLSEKVRSSLNHMGISRLYSHQAESIQASLAGKNVIVATMTSSGKSLCYNVPVLEVLLQNPLSCALYLFPTKALAQDQLRALSAMIQGLDDSLNVGIYDGDTSQEDRLWLQDNARLLITNPDMLHVSILPNHRQFRRILSNLRFIVIDEAHAYKGTFGCHAALILRRLRRICSHVYSSDPSFIFSTATSANPREHVMELANLSTVELIENDGSPSGNKLFMLWNPPLCLKTVWKKKKPGIKDKKFVDKHVVAGRSSPILEVAYLLAEMVQHGLRTIAFCKTRKLCELVLCYTREVLQESAPHLVEKICSYRSGYIAEDRRRIESDIFNGSIRGIAATNALELGIDVGHIDITLHLGFPGSISSLWQQAGRSGRRENPSLAIYVAFEAALDQYFMKLPHKLFMGPIECCHVDAKNEQVLQQHLSCAALEHPLSLIYDEKYFGPGLESAITRLENKGYLSTDVSRFSRIWNYIGHEKSPSSCVNVRAIETIRYKVIDEVKNEVLEEIEESKAFFQVYEGAVYMNQGHTFLVKRLDLSSKIAWCRRADVNYYTKTRDFTDIHVIGSQFAYPGRITNDQFARSTAQTNKCKVKTTWFGFRRIWKRCNQVLDTVELSLPDFSFESQAVWIRVPQLVKTAVENSQYSFREGLHAAGHALLNVVPLFIICNQSDIASECANPHDNRYVPERLLLYDPHPGGTGISAKIQPLFTDLLTAALELLSSCHCSGEAGCPNCVQNLACHEYNEVLHKEAALMIIQGVIDAEKSILNNTVSSKAFTG